MNALSEILKEKILILDGATGTALQKMDLTAADFGGAAYEGCNEHLVLTKPEAITAVHESYLAAGADIIETNSFGSTPLVLAEYGLQDKAETISRVSAELARADVRKHATPARPRFVAGSVGPTTKSLFVTGGVTFDALVETFHVQARGLLAGGVDLFLVETAQDSLNIKAALIGLDRAMAECGRRVPVSVSATVELMGTTLAGQGIEALYYSFQQRDLFSLGLNCATGPDFMADHIRTLADICRFGVSCYPNAGLPDEEGRYNETPEDIAQKMARFVDKGWVNLIGGCCGTTPDHIRRLAQMAEGKPPRRGRGAPRFTLSGLDPFVLTEDMRPVPVGERTNVIGSRKFKEMIVAGSIEEAAEIGRKQARSGAQIIDVCLANPDRNEAADMDAFLNHLTRKVKTPLMIDSTDPSVMELALKKCPGRSVINSINLEDGEERFERVVPLLKTYGAAVVVGCIDEDKTQGMAVTRERKLAVARRAHALLTGKYGLEPEDLVFDPLVFPAATGDVHYVGSARETIEGLRLIKKEFPRCKTVLGVSNVSFGLPEAGREVLNAVFLHHNVEAGLDFAIVNSEKLARYPSIPAEERALADRLLFASPAESKAAVDAFAAYFRNKSARPPAPKIKAGTPAERLPRNVVEGSKEGLLEDLDALLAGGAAPLDIVNGPLMKGMDEVGGLFAKNEMIVAEVLQSAEVMKAAVAHLEPRMSATDRAARGTIVLATVKGDVHDIGKNLVHIILKNNGYRVVDLGIKCPPEDLVRAVREHRPDMVGLSGLLVKSAQQMVATAEDLAAAGIDLPLLVGGAALSEKFTATKIAPGYTGAVLYAKDAMTGLDLANRLVDAAGRPDLLNKVRARQEELRAGARAAAVSSAPIAPATVARHYVPPTPPDLKPHNLTDFSVEDIFRYINPVMLYGKHLGLRGQLAKQLAAGEEKAVKLHREVTALQDEILARRLIRPAAVWRFFAADAEGNRLRLYGSPDDRDAAATFDFPRQTGGEGLCLSDFVLPAGDRISRFAAPGAGSSATGRRDYVALFVVTCGDGVLELSREWREKGDYLKSHALQSIAIESAEAFAELLHERIRAMWGFPDPAGLSLSEKFQAKYRGLRVSFGYPACPHLEDQRPLFRLLTPESIGVRLTENCMMEPEASVSALVFHHPEARYFSVEGSSQSSGDLGPPGG
ncbi:MAG: methionine synthase [Elusimicrobia bacterium]|nr:methionine synthase [Elusimicrobiota bacterium]